METLFGKSFGKYAATGKSRGFIESHFLQEWFEGGLMPYLHGYEEERKKNDETAGAAELLL